MIRSVINDLLLSAIHEKGHFNGVDEILCILSKIISGFAIPLREEHVVFFRTIIIPLHKVQNSHLYHQSLKYCTVSFITKDNSLAIPLLEGLLRYWPFTNSKKEILFLEEILEVLNVCEITGIESLIPKLFKLLMKCISGLHHEVAEKALKLLENDKLISIIKVYTSTIFPLIVPTIYQLANSHESLTFKQSLNAIKEALHQINPNAFEEAVKSQYKEGVINSYYNMYALPQYQISTLRWNDLFQQLQKQDPNFVPPSDKQVVGLYNMNGMQLNSANLIPPI